MFLIVTTLLVWLLSLISLLPAWYYPIEILTNSSHYLLLLNLLLFLVLITIKRYWFLKVLLLGITLMLIAVHCLPILPFFQKAAVTDNQQPSREFSIFLANVQLEQGSPELLRKQIIDLQPDIIGLLEINDAWLSNLNLFADYQYHIKYPEEDNFGLALFSKYPLSEKSAGDFGAELTKHIVAKITPDTGSALELILLHALPPVSAEAIRHNRLMFRRVATYARNSRDNLIVLGDFNATAYSDNYQKLTNWAGLKHAAAGKGLYFSWNAHSFWLKYMIDHILIKGCVESQSFQRLPAIGSDHYPLFAKLRLCSR